MSRIAIFGGTFNPIHNGHLHLCRNCAQILGLDRVILVPAHRPPHKTVRDLASDEDRFAMCGLAVAGDPLFTVSDVELKREGVSYTIYTLETFRAEYPGDELYFILGSDMLFILHQWYRYEDLLTLATVVAGAREEQELERMRRYHRDVLHGDPRVRILSFDALPVSSTELREGLQDGLECVEGFLSPAVAEYIRAHALYREEEGAVWK